jgi:hypothetical protein
VNAGLATMIAGQHWHNIWPPNKANAAERKKPRPLIGGVNIADPNILISS